MEYGYKVLRPRQVTKIRMEPTTWRMRLYRFRYAAEQVALLALLLLCLAYLFR